MMKRYDPMTNCENAVMVESENGDYVDYADAARVYTALVDMVYELSWYSVGYDKMHPTRAAVENAKNIVIDYQGFGGN